MPAIGYGSMIARDTLNPFQSTPMGASEVWDNVLFGHGYLLEVPFSYGHMSDSARTPSLETASNYSLQPVLDANSLNDFHLFDSSLSMEGTPDVITPQVPLAFKPILDLPPLNEPIALAQLPLSIGESHTPLSETSLHSQPIPVIADMKK